jgi:hypothetical protein
MKFIRMPPHLLVVIAFVALLPHPARSNRPPHIGNMEAKPRKIDMRTWPTASEFDGDPRNRLGTP